MTQLMQDRPAFWLTCSWLLFGLVFGYAAVLEKALASPTAALVSDIAMLLSMVLFIALVLRAAWLGLGVLGEMLSRR